MRRMDLDNEFEQEDLNDLVRQRRESERRESGQEAQALNRTTTRRAERTQSSRQTQSLRHEQSSRQTQSSRQDRRQYQFDLDDVDLDDLEQAVGRQPNRQYRRQQDQHQREQVSNNGQQSTNYYRSSNQYRTRRTAQQEESATRQDERVAYQEEAHNTYRDRYYRGGHTSNNTINSQDSHNQRQSIKRDFRNGVIKAKAHNNLEAVQRRESDKSLRAKNGKTIMIIGIVVLGVLAVKGFIMSSPSRAAIALLLGTMIFMNGLRGKNNSKK